MQESVKKTKTEKAINPPFLDLDAPANVTILMI